MKTQIIEYDVAEYLDNDEIIAEYLSAALEGDDPDRFINALNDVIRAKGVTQIAKDANLGRESLYKAFKEGSKPRYDTVFKVTNALGLKIQLKAA